MGSSIRPATGEQERFAMSGSIQTVSTSATKTRKHEKFLVRILFRAFLISWPIMASVAVVAQRGANPSAPENFIKIQGPDVVLMHARVIDGTGAAPLENQTIVVRDGLLAAIGSPDRTPAPGGIPSIDLTGKTVIPGLVMVHEHLYYPTGSAIYGQLGESFTRLYLAGGVTTMRTGGNTNGVMDLNLKQQIDAGLRAGPSIDATAPYLNGPSSTLQMHTLKDADDAWRQVAYWAEMGASSFKAYMQITRSELAAAIEEAHKRGLKITGHLCSVTYAEAADLGIDDLEHGFMVSTDFVSDKKPDECPGQAAGQRTIAALDEEGEPFKALVKKL